MKIINQITEIEKSWWIPAKDLRPGNGQGVFYLTDKGWYGNCFYVPDRDSGKWEIGNDMGTVLYWMPVVMEMEGVTPDGWRDKNV